jgi:hypothetical protein
MNSVAYIKVIRVLYKIARNAPGHVMVIVLYQTHRLRVFKIRFLSTKEGNVNEMGGTCGTHGRGEESVQGFVGKASRKETTCKTKA